MKIAIHWKISSLLFRKILEKIHPKIRFAPVRIWNDEAVVNIKATKKALRLNISINAGGKSNNGLMFFFSSFSSLELIFSFFTKYHIRHRKMEANSPTANPQSWRKGWMKRWSFWSLPSDDSKLQYLNKNGIKVFDEVGDFLTSTYSVNKVFPPSKNR